ncbi:MAG: tRNA (adenosine(37)-N6)-dimethylallyltransferase MiaA [Pseudomonadales bacterium]
MTVHDNAVPPIVVITGATATGKTDLAMALADRMPVQLISVDSAMVYRQMDVGTAKPTAEERRRYPHALVDIRDPSEAYTVAEFVADADREVQQARAAGRVPVLVGGTMMYLKAFRDGLDDLPATTPAVRAAIAAEAATLGWPALHAELTAIDPVAAAGIHPNNPQRLARALEVHRMTGRPLSAFWGTAMTAAQRHACPVTEFWVDVADRAELHARIALRLERMFAAGFVAEVAALRDRGDLTPTLPSLRAVGYRQVWQYLDGALPAEELHARVLAATRGLARRQYTWLRAWAHTLQRVSGHDTTRAVDLLCQLAFP